MLGLLTTKAGKLLETRAAGTRKQIRELRGDEEIPFRTTRASAATIERTSVESIMGPSFQQEGRAAGSIPVPLDSGAVQRKECDWEHKSRGSGRRSHAAQ